MSELRWEVWRRADAGYDVAEMLLGRFAKEANARDFSADFDDDWCEVRDREAEPDPPTCPKCRDRGFLCLTPLGPNAGMGGRNCPDCNADGKIPWRFTALKQRDEEAE